MNKIKQPFHQHALCKVELVIKFIENFFFEMLLLKLVIFFVSPNKMSQKTHKLKRR